MQVQVCAVTIGLPLETTQRFVLYSAARGVLSAAVRLGAAGSYEAQRLQYECIPYLDRTLERCGDVAESDLAQIALYLEGQDEQRASEVILGAVHRHWPERVTTQAEER